MTSSVNAAHPGVNAVPDADGFQSMSSEWTTVTSSCNLTAYRDLT